MLSKRRRKDLAMRKASRAGSPVRTSNFQHARLRVEIPGTRNASGFKTSLYKVNGFFRVGRIGADTDTRTIQARHLDID